MSSNDENYVYEFKKKYPNKLRNENTFTTSKGKVIILYDETKNVLFYIMNISELEPNWKKIFNYYLIDSNAFLIPEEFLHLVKRETLYNKTSFVFNINNKFYYKLANQLYTFYKNNNIVNNELVPVPLSLLTEINPFT